MSGLLDRRGSQLLRLRGLREGIFRGCGRFARGTWVLEHGGGIIVSLLPVDLDVRGGIGVTLGSTYYHDIEWFFVHCRWFFGWVMDVNWRME